MELPHGSVPGHIMEELSTRYAGSIHDDSSDIPGGTHKSAGGGSDIELELDSPACQEGSGVRRERKDNRVAKEKRRRLSMEGGSETGLGDYWDEEDELEDYVMRRDLECGKQGGDGSADELSGASQG